MIGTSKVQEAIAVHLFEMSFGGDGFSNGGELNIKIVYCMLLVIIFPDSSMPKSLLVRWAVYSAKSVSDPSHLKIRSSMYLL